MPVVSLLFWKVTSGSFNGDLHISGKRNKDAKRETVVLKSCKIFGSGTSSPWIQGTHGIGRDATTVLLYWSNRSMPRIPTDRDWCFATPADDPDHDNIHSRDKRARDIRAKDPVTQGLTLLETHVLDKSNYS